MSENKPTINQAIDKALSKDWENGMATTPVTVEREDCYLKVIRKCGNTERPEILLFKAIPKNSHTVDTETLGGHITEALELYGDLCLQFEEYEGAQTAIVPAKIAK
jgi:hypothetical protein